jgi:hypothetical protein
LTKRRCLRVDLGPQPMPRVRTHHQAGHRCADNRLIRFPLVPTVRK